MLLQGAPWHSCYWQGRAAKSHREDAAGRGAVAKHHREDAAGRGAMAELLLARELQRSSIGKMLLAGRRGGAAGTGNRQKQLAGATGTGSRRKQQTGNGHLTEQARSVNLTKQAQDAILAELVQLSFWQTRSLRDREEIVKRS